MNNHFYPVALNAFKSSLNGLPSFCRLTLYELLPYCDYPTGTITIDTLEEISRNDFQVASAPGRKKEEVNGDTIRNALRTIKKAKPDHFIFSSKNQRIIIEMPFIKSLYEEFHKKSNDVAAVGEPEDESSTSLTGTDESSNSTLEFTPENNTEVAAASLESIRDINNINNNNNKKQQNFDSIFPKKSPISSTFAPSTETLNRAIALGFDETAIQAELQGFIDYNQATGSAFADYNPVFIGWLTQAPRRQQQPIASTQIRNIRHVRETKVPAKRPFERVTEAYSRIDLRFSPDTRRFENASSQCAPSHTQEDRLRAYSDLMVTTN